MHALELAGALLTARSMLSEACWRRGRVNGRPEPRIAAGSPPPCRAATVIFLDQLGEVSAAPGVSHGLLALDLLPYIVAGHWSLRGYG